MSDDEVSDVPKVADPSEGLTGRKLKKFLYRKKLNALLDEYKSVLIIQVDNVGSSQMQQVRIALRGHGVMLLGKNTMCRSVILSRKDPKLKALSDLCVMNMGFVFTNGNLKQVRDIIESNKVPAAARVGTIAPRDVIVPPGPTGMDPSQTAFFQSLGIATKIERGNISISNEVKFLEAGAKVTASHVVLLQKLKILPFFYAITVSSVFQDGASFAPAVLDLDQSTLIGSFMSCMVKMAALGMEIGFPTIASVPHSVRWAFRRIVALSLESGFKFKEADELIAGAAAAKAAVGPKKEEKKAAAVEEE